MKTTMPVAVAICLCLLSVSTIAQTAKELSQADVTKIKQLSQVHVKAVLTKDWTMFADTFVEDGAMYPPNDVAVKGRAAIRAYGEKYPPVTAFTASTNEVHGRGDLAYAVGTFEITLAPPGTAPVKDSGKYVEVLRKQANGQWLLVVDMFSSDLPIAPAAK